MSQPLQGKRIIVTGGFGVLGSTLGKYLLVQGAQVALLDRSDAPVALLDLQGLLCQGGVDLTSAASAGVAFDRVAAQWGGIDALVNVAGGFAWETVEQGQWETWDRLFQVNLRTAVVSTQSALTHLLASKAGRIVNIGALASVKASSGMGAYAASKAGVARFTEALAEELKDRGVTVNAVLPSIIDTPANRADMPDADSSRWVTPEALAAVVAFLLSDDAAAVTGALLPVSGRV